MSWHVCSDCLCIYFGQIRGAAALVLLASAKRLSSEEWRVLGVEQLLAIAGKLVSDNTLDARNAAKHLISLLRNVYAQQVWL